MNKNHLKNYSCFSIVMKNKFVMFIIYKIVLDLCFLKTISPTYAYISGYPEPNYFFYVLSWVFLFILLYVEKIVNFVSSEFICDFYLVVSIIPTLSIFWIKNENIFACYLVIVYWLIFFIFSSLFNKSLHTQSKKSYLTCPSDSNIFFIFLFISFLCFTFYFSINYGDFRLFVKFSDVYTYRLGGISMSRIKAYVFSILTTAILPICLTTHLFKKKYILSAIDFFLYLLCYSIYGEKVIFFQAMSIISVFFLFRFKIKSNIINWIIIFLISFMILSFFIPKNLIHGLIHRTFYVPAETHYFYYDFFLENEKLLLRQSFLRHFFTSPYEEPVSVIIGSSLKYNYTGNYNNANNGLFSDAYANFGIVGVFLYPIFLAFILTMFNRYISCFNPFYQYALLIGVLFYALSAPLFQIITSGGILAFILIFSVLKKRKIEIKITQLFKYKGYN